MNIKAKYRRLAAFSHDLAASILSWILAYQFRFNFDVPPYFAGMMWQTLPVVVGLQALIFWKVGLYRGVWRFASLPDLKRILMAVGVSTLMAVVFIFMMQLPVAVPRSVLILNPMSLILFMSGSRLAYRAWKEHHVLRFTQLEGKSVLVVGAGDAAVSLVKQLDRSREWRVVGLLDDKQSLHGLQIHGVNVLGGIGKLAEVANETGAQHVIIALPSASHRIRQQIVHAASDAALSVLTVPSFEDLVSGKVSVSNIRKVEVEDLLGRDPVMLDDAGLHAMLEHRVVMVTGAGGSIGSELCRQIVLFKPSLLVLFELSELALYQLEQEFAKVGAGVRFAYVIGDVKDQLRVESVIRQYRPEIVLHAAAYKHVPLMESLNAGEALRNNVLGTACVARACIAQDVQKFVLISTDKAVNPTNVMGATKRLAELVCQGLQGSGITKFVMVRFGNVLGSSGSVIPKFREQIAKGGPVTVTHPEITRFFMSIPEAAQLVLQAGLMGQGGEIFVLDMGESVKIAELAKEMIRLSGFAEDEIKIVYTGLRPGEKLYEELLADDEHTLPTPHPKLRIAQARSADREWVASLVDWIEQTELDEYVVKQKLRELVTEYQPQQPYESHHILAPSSSAIH